MNANRSILIVAAMLAAAPAALAQSEAPPAQPAKTEPAQPQPESKPVQPHEPTLDELLGLPKAKPDASKPAQGDKAQPEDRTKAELDRQLSAAEVSEAFTQAVQMMSQTADRLDHSHDTGLDTQRMQQDVIQKLDMLIDQAKKQQSQSKSKKQSKPDSSQQQQQQQQQSSQQQSKTNDPKQGGGPELQNGATHASPGGTAVWGSLPEHVRNALMEGRTDQFSSLYKTLTEKYYKRLAEEPKSDTPAIPPAHNP